MHSVEQVLRVRSVVSAEPDERVLVVAERMAERGVGAIPVLRDGRLVGIFSERDLMTRVVVARRDPEAVPVGEVMTTGVVTASLADRTGECEEKMRRAGCRHLPVLAEGRVIGVLSMRDLLQDEIREAVEENRALRAYLHQSPLDA